jgi:hypothetical protein
MLLLHDYWPSGTHAGNIQPIPCMSSEHHFVICLKKTLAISVVFVDKHHETALSFQLLFVNFFFKTKPMLFNNL